jgi:hypothetical protein
MEPFESDLEKLHRLQQAKKLQEEYWRFQDEEELKAGRHRDAEKECRRNRDEPGFGERQR